MRPPRRRGGAHPSPGPRPSSESRPGSAVRPEDGTPNLAVCLAHARCGAGSRTGLLCSAGPCLDPVPRSPGPRRQSARQFDSETRLSLTRTSASAGSRRTLMVATMRIGTPPPRRGGCHEPPSRPWPSPIQGHTDSDGRRPAQGPQRQGPRPALMNRQTIRFKSIDSDVALDHIPARARPTGRGFGSDSKPSGRARRRRGMLKLPSCPGPGRSRWQ